MKPIDLRSDTVSRPTAEMRAVMAAAEVGDDVFGDDPTTLELESEVADLIGMEAALFVPSGTMANQLAVAVQTSSGDEILVEETCHIFQYEGAGAALLSGVQTWPIPGERGMITPAQIRARVRPTDPHCPMTRMLTVENTHNRAGGRVLPEDEVRAAVAEARAHGLSVHLDGARLWNAAAATGRSEADLAEGFDTVSVCFSKGLGAPIGSALLGTNETIDRARFYRKRFGGGMRQVGIIAAGALHAVRNHRKRLTLDHTHARGLAEVIAELSGLSIALENVETNIVVAEVEHGSPELWLEQLAARQVRAVPFGSGAIRFVTHLDVSTADIDEVERVLRSADKEILALA